MSRRVKLGILIFLIFLSLVIIWPTIVDLYYGGDQYECRARYFIGLKSIDENTTMIVVEYCCPGGKVDISYGDTLGVSVIIVNESLVKVATNLEENLKIDGKNVCIYNVMIVDSYYHGVGDYDLVFAAGIKS